MVTAPRSSPVAYLVQAPNKKDRPFVRLDEALHYSLSVGGTLVPLVPAMAPCGAVQCPYGRRLPDPSEPRLTQPKPPEA